MTHTLSNWSYLDRISMIHTQYHRHRLQNPSQASTQLLISLPAIDLMELLMMQWDQLGQVYITRLVIMVRREFTRLYLTLNILSMVMKMGKWWQLLIFILGNLQLIPQPLSIMSYTSPNTTLREYRNTTTMASQSKIFQFFNGETISTVEDQ